MNPTDEQLLNDYESASKAQRKGSSSSSQREPKSEEAKAISKKIDEEARAKRMEKHPVTHADKMKFLVNRAERALRGFNASNAYSFRASSDRLTYERPTKLCNIGKEKEDHIYLDNKAYYPVLSHRDMGRPFPKKVLNNHHHVADSDYTVLIPDKPLIISEPTLPKGYKDGVKLRSPEEILREMEAKKKGISIATSTPPPVRVHQAPKKPMNTLPDSIKDVLQSITDSQKLQEKNRLLKVPHSSSSSSSTRPSAKVPSKPITSSISPSSRQIKKQIPSTHVRKTSPKKSPLNLATAAASIISQASSAHPVRSKSPISTSVKASRSSSSSGTVIQKASTKASRSSSENSRQKTSSSIPKAPWSSSETPAASTDHQTKLPSNPTVAKAVKAPWSSSNNTPLSHEHDTKSSSLKVSTKPPWSSSHNTPLTNDFPEKKSSGVTSSKLAARSSLSSQGYHPEEKKSSSATASKANAMPPWSSSDGAEKKSSSSLSNNPVMKAPPASREVPQLDKKSSTSHQSSLNKTKAHRLSTDTSVSSSSQKGKSYSSKTATNASSLSTPSAEKRPYSSISSSSTSERQKSKLTADSSTSSLKDTQEKMPPNKKRSVLPLTPAKERSSSMDRPRISSKATPSQDNKKHNETGPIDFIEVSKYLFKEVDEFEVKNIASLATPPYCTSGNKPSLTLVSEFAFPDLIETFKRKKSQQSDRSSVKEKSKSKREDTAPKTAPVSLPTVDDVPIKLKKSLKRSHDDIDSQKAPRDPAKSEHTRKIARVSSKNYKQAIKEPAQETVSAVLSNVLPAPISAEFLKSTRIPKRRAEDKRSTETELEEGETRSPSPTPMEKRKTKTGAAPSKISERTSAAPVSSSNRESLSHQPQEQKKKEEPTKSSPLSRGRSPSRRDSARQDVSPSTTRSSRSPKRDAPRRDSSRAASPVKRNSARKDHSPRRRSRSPVRREARKVESKRSRSPAKRDTASRRSASPEKQSTSRRPAKPVVAAKNGEDAVLPMATPVTSTQAASSGSQTSKSSPTILSEAQEHDRCKLNQFMYKQLATATKHRGDGKLETKAGVLDHYHALCSYMMSFHYADKLNRVSIRESTTHWKTLFPFCENLMRKLAANKMNELIPLCLRLMALVRFYLFRRVLSSLPPLPSSDDPSGLKVYMEMSAAVFREYLKGSEHLQASEPSMSIGGIQEVFPITFQDVCVRGDLQRGFIQGLQDGDVVGPMVPFQPFSELHHSSIVARMILLEYAATNGVAHTPITKPEEYM